MSEFKDLARKFLRRSSAQTSVSPSSPTSPDTRRTSHAPPRKRPSIPRLVRPQSRRQSSTGVSSGPASAGTPAEPPSLPTPTFDTAPKPVYNYAQQRVAPTLMVQEPSPELDKEDKPYPDPVTERPQERQRAPPTPISRPISPKSPEVDRSNQTLGYVPQSINRSLPIDTPPTLQEEPQRHPAQQDYFGPVPVARQERMVRRKVWIKRAGASPTLVQITDEDLVDDVRDLVLRKYGNSLGRTWDSPDVSVRICPRERTHQERLLGPEEPICGLLDAYYPGGQHIEEALMIEVPRRRSPQRSPRILYPHNEHYNDSRPVENGGTYFPTMPAASPHPTNDSRGSPHPVPPHSIGVIETGQLPVLPSPRERKSHYGRPKAHRQHTSSPTFPTSGAPLSNNTQQPGQRPKHISRTSIPAPPPIPSPPAADSISKGIPTKPSSPPIDRIGSPRFKPKKKGNKSISESRQQEIEDRRPSHPLQPQIPSLVEAIVPPINVLIVEDNPINMRLLEEFVKRLKVRWSTAMNGRDAVVKWRSGGFHLVLMDIQLPIMNGLEATKEIRRLERVNGIGVFAKGDDEERKPPTPSQGSSETVINTGEADNGDKLIVENLFKSPVIIVALTASSLQSDRHEALAAGCNDFLTKVRLLQSSNV